MAATKTATASQPNNPFIKNLASSNPTTRTTALTTLKSYLSSHPLTSRTEILKLWKGLFYSMYMCDKPLNQQNLARSIAQLLSTQKTTAAKVSFLEGFWIVMGKEWNNIDYLRMDKYLYLVRCMVGASLPPSSSEVEAYITMLSSAYGPLGVGVENKCPTGLKLHVLDVWVDELEKAGVEDEVLEKLMRPIQVLGKESAVKSVRVRAKETLGDERLVEQGKRWKTEEEKADEDGEEEEEEGEDFGGFDD